MLFLLQLKIFVKDYTKWDNIAKVPDIQSTLQNCVYRPRSIIQQCTDKTMDQNASTYWLCDLGPQFPHLHNGITIVPSLQGCY